MEADFWRRTGAQPIYMEALPHRRPQANSSVYQPALGGAVFEEPVAAAVLQCAPDRQETAYLAMLHCVNDEETLDRLLATTLDTAFDRGCTRVVGPTGPVPSWASGALINAFDALPPGQTPYNPPYLADLLRTSMTVCLESALLHVPVSDCLDAQGPALLAPLDLTTLDDDLLSLLDMALSPHCLAPGVASDELRLLLKWLAVSPLTGWQAQIDGVPVGLALVQPDLAPLMRRTRGGRTLPWRWYAAWAKHRPALRGRLLLGAVSPPWRRQGIGRQLLAQVLRHATVAGWRELVCGPYVTPSAAVEFFLRAGAVERQRYELFEWNG